MEAAATAWWIWPLALFAVSFAIGIVAVLAGIGGGVLFVPIVAGFFPFHLDFVRAAGLLVALSGALSASPRLLQGGLASLPLGLPLALVGSITAIAGASLSFALPADALQAALGVTILAAVALMWRRPAGAAPSIRPDAISEALRLHGVFHDPASGQDTVWRAQRTPAGLAAFALIGFIAGMFGLGAGWANVPVLTLLMGVPLKLAVGTSGFILSVIDTAAAWVYLHRGAVLPMLVVPSIIGVMLGAKLGVRALARAPARIVRRAVLVLLLLAAFRALGRGFGLWT
ncbi:MAG TPA: sulfite exporter TauE/SafE family protein [Burkholderiales bacterium]|nr:sulfite exporter TauE/SafE family protein [Burkholderiales bacterium]